MAYANIDKCGLYQDDCHDWSRKPRIENTWVKSKTHFDQAFKEIRRSSKTSRSEGYVAHVHAAQANAELFTEMQQDHTQALANLATATQAHRTSVVLLTKTISELSSQVALLTAKLATEQAENARMKKSGKKSTLAGQGHRSSSHKILLETNTAQYRNLYSHSGQRFDPNGYCSSHGYKVEESHTSATCRFLNSTHNKSATRLNIMGGKTWKKDWINGGPT